MDSRKFKSNKSVNPRQSSYTNKFKNEVQGSTLKYVPGETFMSDHEHIRNELKKVGKEVHKSIFKETEKDVRVRMPPRHDVKKLPTKKYKEEIEFDKHHRNELRNIFKEKPKEEKSFNSIHKKIQEQQENWKNMKSIGYGKSIQNNTNWNPPSPNPSLGKYNNPNRFEKIDSIKETREVVSDKLAEISRQFRESLKLSSNPNNFIKTPKYSSLNFSTMAKKSKAILDAKYSMDSLKLDQDNFANSQEMESLLMSRPGIKFFPKGKGVTFKNKNVTPGTVSTSTTIRRPNEMNSSNPIVKPTKRQSTKDGNLDFAGIVKLRSLLEANNSELFSNKINEGDMDNHRHTVDPNYPHQPIEILMGPRKNMDPYMIAKQVMKEKQDKKMYLEMASSVTPIIVQTSSDNDTEIQKKVDKISSNIKMSPKSHEQYSYISRERIQQKLSDSVKTLDEAAKVANALGSLMTRVAASRIGRDEIQSKLPVTKEPDFYNNNYGMYKMTENIGSGTEPEYDEVGREVQTQTDMPSYYSMKPPIPEIIFKRDMTVIDQKKLEELRAKKREWDTEAAQLWRLETQKTN